MKLLVLAHDVALQLAISGVLRREGHQFNIVEDVASAQTQIAQERPNIILVDLALLGDHIEQLGILTTIAEDGLILALCDDFTSASAIDALRQGVFDLLHKPLNIDLARNALRHADEYQELRRTAREVERLRELEDSMRTTARAAAHHISQHLTVIMGETQLLQEEVSDPETSDALKRILQATEHAAQVLADLRSARHFSKREVAEEWGEQGGSIGS
jgi:DNA-binding NtrC family response regulator